MKTILTTLFIIIGFSAHANNVNVKCSTPRNNVVLKLVNNKLKMDGRFPAESVAQRTRKSGDSLTKIFYIDGEKHTIHFENTKNFSENDNYINIKTRRGHEITFPLECKRS